jgi:hypothetical protein
MLIASALNPICVDPRSASTTFSDRPHRDDLGPLLVISTVPRDVKRQRHEPVSSAFRASSHRSVRWRADSRPLTCSSSAARLLLRHHLALPADTPAFPPKNLLRFADARLRGERPASAGPVTRSSPITLCTLADRPHGLDRSRIGTKVAVRSPVRLGLTCTSCGSTRLIPLTFDQVGPIPSEERPTRKCVSCGARVFQARVSAV